MRKTAILFISLMVVIGNSEIGVAQNVRASHSFNFSRIALRQAIDSLMKWYPESIIFLDGDIEGKSVSAIGTDCDFNQALNNILYQTSLTWVKRGNQVILKNQENRQPREYGTILGTVTDSLTHEWLINANVLLQDSTAQPYHSIRRWCSTNQFGFFSLPRVTSGSYTLVVRSLGYQPVMKQINVIANEYEQHDFDMVQKDIIVQPITIEGHRTTLTSVEGFSRGIFLRSAPSDQNQYLLDGARIYNPSHFGGVLNTFNPEVLNDIQVVVGGVPPSYGGRIGNIVDLSMRDGTRSRLSGSAGMGTIGSNLSIEGPINSTTTFLLSGRGGYPNVAMQSFQTDQALTNMNSYELTTKLTHRLSGNSQLSLSGYLGKDSYKNSVVDSVGQLNNNFSWTNSMIDLRWLGIVSPSLFIYSSAVFSRYDFTLNHSLTQSSNHYFSSLYTIEDISIRAHIEDYYDDEHTVHAGVELIHHRINGDMNAFSLQTSPFSFQNVLSWEASVYLQDQWKVLPRVLVELGGRATSFIGDRGSFSAIDPRFSLEVSLDEQTLAYSSLTAINEFIHPYQNSGVFLLYPTIFWYPSTGDIKPTTSLQAKLGVQKNMDDDTYTVSAESYYRMTNDLHEFGFDTIPGSSKDLSNLILYGTGKKYGATATLSKRTGDLTFSINYNLAWSLETFSLLNNGNSFSPPFDRRHEVQISASYSGAENWVFGILCMLTSGQSPSYSAAVAQSKMINRSNLGTETIYNSLSVAGEQFVNVNGSKLPGFQRIELSAFYTFGFSGLPCQLSLRLLNGYGLLDPYTWTILKSKDPRLMWNVYMQEPIIFPIYPVIGFCVRF